MEEIPEDTSTQQESLMKLALYTPKHVVAHIIDVDTSIEKWTVQLLDRLGMEKTVHEGKTFLKVEPAKERKRVVNKLSDILLDEWEEHPVALLLKLTKEIQLDQYHYLRLCESGETVKLGDGEKTKDAKDAKTPEASLEKTA